MIPAAVVCFLFLLLPLPSIDFVATSRGLTVGLPAMSEAGAAELDELQAAAEDPLVQQRLVGAEVGVDEFTMIGVVLDELPREPVLVRVLEQDGWSSWMELEVSADDGPDPGTAEAADASEVITSEPIWVGDATGYELSLTAGDAESAEVALVRSSMERVVVDATPFADASSAPFPVNTRATWNTRSTSTSSTGALRMAVVHHTASSNNYSEAQVPGILRSIQAFHMDTNGWSDIGYNFLVDKFGRIWEGRAGSMQDAVIGAHAAGFNTGSVGVSIIGNYVGVAASPAALEATSRVVGWRLWAYNVSPTGRADITSLGSNTIPAGTVVNLPRVVGHRDVGATACPGSIYGSLGSVRNRAAEWFRQLETTRNPIGSLDRVTVDGARITVSGWAKDPDTDASVVIHIYAGPRSAVTTASQFRPDVGAARPGFGNHRGYTAVLDGMAPGNVRVCAYAINQGRGTGNPALGCVDTVIK